MTTAIQHTKVKTRTRARFPQRRKGLSHILVRVVWAAALLILVVSSSAQVIYDPQLSKEYIRAGNRLIAIEDPPPAGPATVVSLSPTSGTGMSQLFTATYSHSLGSGNITDALFLVQTGVNGVNACYLKYSVQAKAFYLTNDAATVWQGPVTPLSQSNVENSQCVLSGSASNVTGLDGSSTNLVVTFALSFKTAFAGARSTYMYVSDRFGGVSNWQTEGSWTVAATAQPPVSLTVSPLSGSGVSGNFAFSGVSANGFEYIDSVQMIFNWTVDGTDGCYVQYYRSANAIYLVNDQGNASLGGYAPGTANTIQNSQCTIDVSRTVVTGSFNTLTVSPYITFKSSFPGPQGVFLYMSDIGGLASGWQTVGSWTGYAASSQVPTPSVSPASGAGMSQVFAFQTNDVNGYKYVAYEQILINSSINASSACSLLYYRGWNLLFLANDANNSWGSGAVLGTSGTLSNSQCSVNIGGSSSSGGGNDLYVNLAITFTSAFGGARNTYMYVTDHAFQVSGWQQVGTWIVSSLTPVSVSPASGFGAYRSFAVAYYDSAGYTDINEAKFLVQTSVNGVNACYLKYNVQTNGFYLTDDAASYWQGPVTPGTAGSVQNSRCILTGNTSSVSYSGGNLTATFGLSFTSAFSGAKNTYAYVNTVSGPVAGWVQLGTWTIP
jgi:hypothetical protein